MESDGPVIVHRCYDDVEAAQIRDLLLQEGIACQVASNVPHSVLPLTTNGLGEVRIAVRASDAPRAVELIRVLLAEDDLSTAGAVPCEDSPMH